MATHITCYVLLSTWAGASIGRENPGLDAFTLEYALQVIHNRLFIAGRITGVKAEDGLEVTHRLFFNGSAIRLRGLPKRGEEQKCHTQECLG